MPQKRPERGQLPTRDEILAFIAENPGRVSKRDIAKAFGITGSHVRTKLKELLRTMKEEGQIGRTAGRRLEIAGDLPSEMAVEIIDIDDDGRAIAEPLMWHGDTPPPRIPLLPGSGKRGGPAPGIGDRAFVQVRRDGEHWEGRVRRMMEGEAEQIVGVFRNTSAGDRIIPTDRRKGHNFHAQLMPGIAPEHGDLVLAEPL
ncbi:MAG: ribonuclease R, partial [Proteobacteria bacterium]|nr:ribonuclease R [Pseudomonadota bacterium]